MHVTLVYLSHPHYVSDFPLPLHSLKEYALSRKRLADNIEFSIVSEATECDSMKFMNDIVSSKPDVIGFSTFVWNITKILDLCSFIKAVLPDTKIVLGGAQASGGNEIIMAETDDVDIIVLGEGERTFADILEVLLDDPAASDFAGIKGLVFRAGDKVVNTGIPDPIIELDEIPAIFEKNVDSFNGAKFRFLEMSRGCNYRCFFCQWQRPLSKPRYHSLERVKSELTTCFDNGVSRVHFLDSAFNADHERSSELLRWIMDANEDTDIWFNFNPRAMNDDFIALLQKMKIPPEIGIGIQSTNPVALENMNRSWFDPEQFEKKFDLMKGLRHNFQFIYGLPGDTYRTVAGGVEWAMQLGTTAISMENLLLLPGTCFYDDREKFNIRFNPKPPYQVIGTDCMEPEEFSKLDMLAIGIDVYNYFSKSFVDAYVKALGLERTEALMSFGKYCYQNNHFYRQLFWQRDLHYIKYKDLMGRFIDEDERFKRTGGALRRALQAESDTVPFGAV